MAGRPRAKFPGKLSTREGRAFKAAQEARHESYERRKAAQKKAIRRGEISKGPRGGVTGGLG